MVHTRLLVCAAWLAVVFIAADAAEQHPVQDVLSTFTQEPEESAVSDSVPLVMRVLPQT